MGLDAVEGVGGGGVGGAVEGGVDLDFGADAGEGHEGVEEEADGGGGRGGDVVGVEGVPGFEKEGVGADDVADVGEVADGIEVADAEDGGVLAVGDGLELPREGGGDEGGPSLLGRTLLPCESLSWDLTWPPAGSWDISAHHHHSFIHLLIK